jgi:hypothetical protein
MDGELAKEWGTKNDLTPSEVYYRSSTKVWWECKLGHSWEAPPVSRAKGSGCPHCWALCSKSEAGFGRKRPSASFLDIHPLLSQELVDKSLASQYSQSSHVAVEWQCNAYPHRYTLSFNERVSGRGCPFCAFTKLLSGFNDLASVRKDLSSELAPPYLASNYLANSKESVRWTHHTFDGRLHTWFQDVNSRVYSNVGCAVCSGRTAQPGVNDFAEALKDMPLLWSSINTFPPTAITRASRKDITLLCANNDAHPAITAPAKSFTKATSPRRCSLCKKVKAISSPTSSVTKKLPSLDHNMGPSNGTHLQSNETHCQIEVTALNEHLGRYIARNGLDFATVLTAVGTGTVVNNEIIIVFSPIAENSEDLISAQADFSAHGLKLYFIYPWEAAKAHLILEDLLGELNFHKRQDSYTSSVKELTPSETDAFLKKNSFHRGRKSGLKVNMGLVDGDELIAVQQYARLNGGGTEAHVWEEVSYTAKQANLSSSDRLMLQTVFVEARNPDLIIAYVDNSKEQPLEREARGFTRDSKIADEFWWALDGAPKQVTIIDKNGVSRQANIDAVLKTPYLASKRVVGRYGKGVGVLFFGGKLGSRRELLTSGNGDLTHNDAILKALGYKKVFTAGHTKYSLRFTQGVEHKNSIWGDWRRQKSSYKISAAEMELAVWVTSLGFNVEQSNRTILAGRELDIYLPELHKAIEFNGAYWHSESFIEATKGKSAEEYHLQKYDDAAKCGIEVAFVWGNDWDNYRDKVRQELLRWLGGEPQGAILKKFSLE